MRLLIPDKRKKLEILFLIEDLKRRFDLLKIELTDEEKNFLNNTEYDLKLCDDKEELNELCEYIEKLDNSYPKIEPPDVIPVSMLKLVKGPLMPYYLPKDF